ncbi:hypothetical protein MHBO_003037 [Bonamia ostreae]|uniref:Uncharacterized protein n=1 Tax=Bonamia ostreae TaxID=126728 RepID=A0ABV2APB6_9EUKA
MFYFPPVISKWIRSMKGYNIIFLRSHEVARKVLIFTKHNPKSFVGYSGLAIFALYLRSKHNLKKSDSMKDNEMFAHPKNRNLRDQWGHRLIETRPFFRRFLFVNNKKQTVN